MINDKMDDKEYWEGIRDACEYFVTLGVEDAMNCDIAVMAQKESELV